MSTKSMDTGKDMRQRDPDLAGAEVSMKRAAVRARQKARQAGLGVMVWKNGRIVEERQPLPSAGE